MHPTKIGASYDKIASWWQRQHQQSTYGVSALECALKFLSAPQTALDVGCGAGGRLVEITDRAGLTLTGVDVSEKMCELAASKHPQHRFINADICEWQSTHTYDLIFAWDSLFHLPLEQQKPVLNKLCSYLNENGVIMYTFGDAEGEHTDSWKNDTFYYSSIGIQQNLEVLQQNGLTPVHLELDQHPQNHVVVIAQKRAL